MQYAMTNYKKCPEKYPHSVRSLNNIPQPTLDFGCLRDRSPHLFDRAFVFRLTDACVIAILVQNFDLIYKSSMYFSEFKKYRNSIIQKGDKASLAQKMFQDTQKAIYVIDRGIQRYRDDLPFISTQTSFDSYEGAGSPKIDIVSSIETQLQQKLDDDRKDKVAILDIGCGRGDFLVELFDHLAKKFFEGDVEHLRQHASFTGVSIADLRNSHFDRPVPDNEERLRSRGIEYLEGDMRFLSTLLPGNLDSKFDCIVSNVAICYVQPSRMRKEVLRQIYRALKLNGVASLTYVNLIHPEMDYPFLLSEPEYTEIVSSVNHQLRLNGLMVECVGPNGSHLVMRKNKRPFVIDLPYDTDGELPGLFRWANSIQGIELPCLQEAQKNAFKKAYANVFVVLFDTLKINNEDTELRCFDADLSVKAHLPLVFRSFIQQKIGQHLKEHLQLLHKAETTYEMLIDHAIKRFFVFSDEART